MTQLLFITEEFRASESVLVHMQEGERLVFRLGDSENGFPYHTCFLFTLSHSDVRFCLVLIHVISISQNVFFFNFNVLKMHL